MSQSLDRNRAAAEWLREGESLRDVLAYSNRMALRAK